MTDRIHSLTVVLDHNIRDDDVQCIVDAIKMIRCVGEVVPQVADGDAWMAESGAKQDWSTMLYYVLRVSSDFDKREKLKTFLETLK